MSLITDRIVIEVKKFINPEKTGFFPGFFQAYPGGYGEGDKFLGVVVPDLRKISKKYASLLKHRDIEILLQNEYHEIRTLGLYILRIRYEKEKNDAVRTELFDLYLGNARYINNWDLVDCSAPYISGHFLYHFPEKQPILDELAGSGNIWKQRIAIMSTFYFIRNNEFGKTLILSLKLLHHEHDLIHKAVGWMLREVGKRDYEREYGFLKENYKTMPRTMLRYAIEKFDEKTRQGFLKGTL